MIGLATFEEEINDQHLRNVWYTIEIMQRVIFLRSFFNF